MGQESLISNGDVCLPFVYDLRRRYTVVNGTMELLSLQQILRNAKVIGIGIQAFNTIMLNKYVH